MGLTNSCRLPPTYDLEPDNYQLDGVCFALDGDDVVATMATETGTTDFFIFLIFIICPDPTLALNDVTFPKDPAMIVVCPTKALQEDMVRDKLCCHFSLCHDLFSPRV